jgi:ATP-GRASP peptide maturase of grasp-with-spasm system
VIVILSSCFDVSTYKVLEWLRYYQASFFLLHEKTRVQDLDIRITIEGKKAMLATDTGTLDLDDVGAAWFRRFGFMSSANIPLSAHYPAVFKKQLTKFLHAEVSAVREFIFMSFNGKYFVNKPADTRLNKISALAAAQAAGLAVPETAVHSSQFMVEGDTQLEYITKSISERIAFYYRNHMLFNNTSRIDRPRLQFPIPALIQRLVRKKFEVRSFYLAPEFYSVAIFSQSNEDTQTDYRNYDVSRPNRMVPIQLPAELVDRLRRFMKVMDLESGSVDLIYTDTRQFIFLEVNPVGQFDIMEGIGNYPVSQLIAKKLTYENDRRITTGCAQ